MLRPPRHPAARPAEWNITDKIARRVSLFSGKARADERELREFARANLAHFKAPHSVSF